MTTNTQHLMSLIYKRTGRRPYREHFEGRSMWIFYGQPFNSIQEIVKYLGLEGVK